MGDIEQAASDVDGVLARYPLPLQKALQDLRSLIFEVSAGTQGVGELQETLKWGQPSYLTPKTKSGTTIRFDKDETNGGDYALYVNCQTTLVDEWREHYPEFAFGGTRSVHFKLNEALPRDAVRHMIAMALTYHSRKKRAG